MEDLIAKPGNPLRGDMTVPGDKSISHRAVLFGGLLAQGECRVRGWLRAGDTTASLAAVRALGIDVTEYGPDSLIIYGAAPSAPGGPLDLGNAGTGLRLLAGIMAGQPFDSTLTGSDQLRRRPMRRIIEPLQAMGAAINGEDDRAPLTIHPAALQGITYEMPVASAQVKSALLLAALFADGPTTVRQPGPSRDHTEVMLRAMGAAVESVDHAVSIRPDGPLEPFDMTVPGDFSSAAFPLVAASVLPGSNLTIRHVNLNPTRTGLLDVLQAMGAAITVTETGTEAGEPVGDLHVTYAPLKGVTISGEMVVRMIDEFPALMIAATQAEGETVVKDARELRVKETDRIAVMAGQLRALGADVAETEDGFVLEGGVPLSGASVNGYEDHRVAMSMALAGLLATGQTRVAGIDCAADSFPGFVQTMAKVGADFQTVTA